MAIWGAVISGVVAGGAAYYQTKQNKKLQKQKENQYDEQVAFAREQLENRKNSMGARMAPYLMDQMLRVYAEQSKGRGGFNLPIDEILKNMNIEGRKSGGGSFGGGGASADYSTYSSIPNNLWMADRKQKAEDQRLRQVSAEQPIKQNITSRDGLAASADQLRGYNFDDPISLRYGREDTSNLDAARNEALHDLGMKRPEGIDVNMDMLKKFGGGLTGLWGLRDKAENAHAAKAQEQYMQQLVKLMQLNQQNANTVRQAMGPLAGYLPYGGM